MSTFSDRTCTDDRHIIGVGAGSVHCEGVAAKFFTRRDGTTLGRT
jgi:hypothetical protein